MTVVTTPTSTWPAVQPERTTLLDPTCAPKQTDGFRVLFEFKLDSCGTRAMVQIENHANEKLYKCKHMVKFCNCGQLTGWRVIHGLWERDHPWQTDDDGRTKLDLQRISVQVRKNTWAKTSWPGSSLISVRGLGLQTAPGKAWFKYRGCWWQNVSDFWTG